MVRGKKGSAIAADTIVKWIVGIAVLALVIAMSVFLSQKGIDILKYLKSLAGR